MSESNEQKIRALLQRIPDLPRNVELRGILLERSAVIHGEIEACVVRGRSDRYPSLIVIGEPSLETIKEAVNLAPRSEMIVFPESYGYIASIVGQPGVRAYTHRLMIDRLPTDLRETRLLFDSDARLMVSVPEPLRGELDEALRDVPVAAAFADGWPVSFCYPCAISETLWDISIDTIEHFRRRGLAGLAVALMVGHMRDLGKEPIWGAIESNLASIGLARKLGFEVVDEAYIFSSREKPLLPPPDL